MKKLSKSKEFKELELFLIIFLASSTKVKFLL